MTQHAWEEFSNRRVDRHELVRRHNQELVLSTFLTGGEYTRVQVADMTSLSKPTVNAIVEDLLHSGLVEKVGSRVGVAGRSAAVYRPDPRGGSVVAIDIGARKIRGAVANLVGEIVFERTVDTPRRGRLVDEASSLIADLASNSGAYPNSPSLAVVGSPGVVDPMTGLLSHALNTPELIGLPLGQRLQERTGMPVLVENDVNLATVGEYHHGRAQEIGRAHV